MDLKTKLEQIKKYGIIKTKGKITKFLVDDRRTVSGKTHLYAINGKIYRGVGLTVMDLSLGNEKLLKEWDPKKHKLIPEKGWAKPAFLLIRLALRPKTVKEIREKYKIYREDKI